nr:dual specificity protein kinase pyk3 isoform X2 [Bactrocera oleae]
MNRDIFYSEVGMANDYYANVTGVPSCSSSRWLTEEVFKLIDMVQHDEAIYNPRHKYYFCRPYVENFWREVDQKLEKNPGASLAKWTNLRISFRREYTNYLEEKVPPCWTYFDRMFFLHPYLRKKHTQPKSLDSQVQDALVRISSLSDRLQRERTAAVAANAAAALSCNNVTSEVHSSILHPQQTHQQPIDNYLEYFDDAEPNNSDDLEDVIDDEQRNRFRPKDPHIHPLNNDIKSECDDVKSDVDDYEPEIAAERHEEEDNELEEMEMRNFMMDSYANSNSTTTIPLEERRAQLRMQQFMRLQSRSYQDEFRVKRPRSQDSISSTHAIVSGTAGSVNLSTTVGSSSHTNTHPSAPSIPPVSASGHTRMHSSQVSTATTHTNISLVRPTLAKPMELVSTTTSNSGNVGLSIGAGVNIGNALTNNPNNDADVNASSTSSISNQGATTSAAMSHQHHQRHTSASHHTHNYSHHSVSGSSNSHHRLEIASISSGTVGAGLGSSAAASTAVSVPTLMNAANTSAPPPASQSHVELCDCKTDPDAMFLMSLLPDIQKLNGRDRGKIKIAFQNILQDYLYPD